MAAQVFGRARPRGRIVDRAFGSREKAASNVNQRWVASVPMSQPKRHHYVPQMVLREWADHPGSEHVWVVDRSAGSKPRRAHIRDAMVVAQYYTLGRERPTKADSLWIEELMADWEGRASKAIPLLKEIPSRRHDAIVPWLVFQLLRTPQGQAQLADDLVQTLRRAAWDPAGLIPFWTERKGRQPTADETHALVVATVAIRDGKSHPMTEPTTTNLLNHMIAVAVYGHLGEQLVAEGEWATLHTDPGSYVIGDHPVTYRGMHNPARPVWRQRDLPTQMTMPIAHDVCLEIRGEPRRIPFDQDEIDQINLRAWHWADRWVAGNSAEALERVADVAETVECRTPLPTANALPRRR